MTVIYEAAPLVNLDELKVASLQRLQASASLCGLCAVRFRETCQVLHTAISA